MTSEEPISVFILQDRREKREFRHRMKQFIGVLTNAGYALLAGGGWRPLLDSTPFQLIHALALCLGVAMLIGSIYLAPRGELDDDRR